MPRKPRQLPDHKTLHQLFEYDPDTGVLRWKPRTNCPKQWNTIFAGQECNSLRYNGYLRVRLDGREALVHRVVWKMVHGKDPEHIDHINGDRTDNRIANLRSVNSLANQRNAKRYRTNKSGITGVRWCKQRKRWCAYISIHDRAKNLGRFKTKEEAILARKQAEEKLGFHTNHGR